jgi:hypothetical protein
LTPKPLKSIRPKLQNEIPSPVLIRGTMENRTVLNRIKMLQSIEIIMKLMPINKTRIRLFSYFFYFFSYSSIFSIAPFYYGRYSICKLSFRTVPLTVKTGKYQLNSSLYSLCLSYTSTHITSVQKTIVCFLFKYTVYF